MRATNSCCRSDIKSKDDIFKLMLVRNRLTPHRYNPRDCMRGLNLHPFFNTVGIKIPLVFFLQGVLSEFSILNLAKKKT